VDTSGGRPLRRAASLVGMRCTSIYSEVIPIVLSHFSTN
jgi:hypothetical protein